MNTLNDILCIEAHPDRVQEATQFARQHQLTLCPAESSQFELQLRFGLDHISLYDAALATSINIDFTGGTLGHRQRFGGGKGQPLARAIGLNKFPEPRVFDVTAGLARDAFVLASLGCQLTLVEQSSVLHCLIEDGVARALAEDSENPVARFGDVICADSLSWLQTLEPENYPDVIYIDPMYPPRRKSAMVKKDMQLLHKLIGPDTSAAELLQLARQRCHKRVTVKRPTTADHLPGPAPSAAISSKNTRYDIYLSTVRSPV